MFLWLLAVSLCLLTLIRLSVTCSRNRLSSDEWILRHVLKFQPRRAKHHAKCVRRYRSASGRSMTLLALSPADFRRFLTVLVDRRLLGSQFCLSTGLVANGIRLAKRCNVLSSRSDVTRGLPDLGKSFTLLVCVYFLTSRLRLKVYVNYITCLFFCKNVYVSS